MKLIPILLLIAAFCHAQSDSTFLISSEFTFSSYLPDTSLTIATDFIELRICGETTFRTPIPKEVMEILTESNARLYEELRVLQWKERYYKSQFGEIFGSPDEDCMQFVPVKIPTKTMPCKK